MENKDIFEIISDDKQSVREINRIYKKFKKKFNSLSILSNTHNEEDSKKEILDKAILLAKRILLIIDKENKINLSKLEPGHGPGHFIRDYINSIILLKNLDVPNKSAFLGLIASLFRDISCAIVARDKDGKRVLTHAEISALLVDDLIRRHDILDERERLIVVYSIAAHTHYLKKFIFSSSGVEKRVLSPHLDKFFNSITQKEELFWPIWIVRWIDRLDCSGPSFLPRQYLKLAFHEGEFDGQDYYDSNFLDAMNPRIRNIKSDGKRKSVVEHIIRYSNTQNNESVYGQYDTGHMKKIRDKYLSHTKKIISSFSSEVKNISPAKIELALKSWNNFLVENVESGETNQFSVQKLSRNFLRLPKEFKEAWFNGIISNMSEYKEWYSDLLLSQDYFKKEWLVLPGISDNIFDKLKPNAYWKNRVDELG